MKQKFKPMDIVYCPRYGVGIILDSSDRDENIVIASFAHGGYVIYDKDGKAEPCVGKIGDRFSPDELDIRHYDGNNVLYTLNYEHSGWDFGKSFLFHSWDETKSKIEELANRCHDNVNMKKLMENLYVPIGEYGIIEIGIYQIGDEL